MPNAQVFHNLFGPVALDDERCRQHRYELIYILPQNRYRYIEQKVSRSRDWFISRRYLLGHFRLLSRVAATTQDIGHACIMDIYWLLTQFLCRAVFARLGQGIEKIITYATPTTGMRRYLLNSKRGIECLICAIYLKEVAAAILGRSTKFQMIHLNTGTTWCIPKSYWLQPIAWWRKYWGTPRLSKEHSTILPRHEMLTTFIVKLSVAEYITRSRHMDIYIAAHRWLSVRSNLGYRLYFDENRHEAWPCKSR